MPVFHGVNDVKADRFPGSRINLTCLILMSLIDPEGLRAVENRQLFLHLYSMHCLIHIRKSLHAIGAALLLLVAATASFASSSLDLSGANDYAFTPDAEAFDFAGSFTIDLKFRSLAATDGCLLAKFHQSSGSTLDDSYYILVKADGSLEARVQSTTLLATLAGGSGAHDGNWHHVALIYDIDEAITELYLDGVLVDTDVISAPVRDSAEPIRLGALRTTGTLASFFVGYIDELRFWNVPRRGEQAGCLRDVTILEDTPGLISYYRFDEETGSDALDLVPPFENFQLISGALFSSVEPTFLSRLSGPGQCLCGEISGAFTALDPAITLVGDSVRVAAGDSLELAGVTLTIDSSVTSFSILGYLSTSVLNTDSCRIAPQSGGYSGSIHFAGDPTSQVSHSIFDGFAGRALLIDSSLSVSNCSFASGVQVNGCAVSVDSCVFQACADPVSGGALALFSAQASISATEFDANSAPEGMAIYADSSLLAISNCVFRNHFSALADSSAVLYCSSSAAPPAQPMLSRSLLYDNETRGSLLEFTGDAAPAEWRNLTLTANDVTRLLEIESPLLISSSILLGNSGNGLQGEDLDVYFSLTSEPAYLNQNGNFTADPLFSAPLLRDFGLSAGSPAINRGDPNSLYNDSDGTRSDIGALAAGSFAATLESILDVPHDNGRQVMIQWLPSAGDDAQGGIASYSVWRKVNLAIVENFELIAELPAGQLPGYGQIAPTLADSNQSGIPYYSYFVRAHSTNPLAFWDTPLDSAYSVDNLAPEAPSLLAAREGGDVRLTWDAIPDSDFAYFAIYRAPDVFDPDTLLEPFLTTTDTTLLDLNVPGDQVAYVVRAVDWNDNFSDASNLELIELSTLPAPSALTLLHDNGLLFLRWYSAAGAGHYSIFRTSNFGDPWDYVATTTDTFFVTTPSADRYFFQVHSEP